MQPGESFYAEYQLQETIGSGAFGRALKAKRRVDGEEVVVKEIITATMSEKEMRDTKMEVKVLAFLSHPSRC